MKRLIFLLCFLSNPLIHIESNARSYEENNFRNSINEVITFYKAEHRIRKMFVQSEQVSSSSHVRGGFFFFVSNTNENHTVTHVRFGWEIKDKTYVITTLPIEKIRIKLTDKNEAPSVSFSLDEYTIDQAFEWEFRRGMENVDEKLVRILKDQMNPGETFSRFLAYATITVEDKDWPSNINLPVNKSYGN